MAKKEFTQTNIMTEQEVADLKKAFGKVEGYNLIFEKDQYDRPYPVVSNGKDSYTIDQGWQDKKYTLFLPYRKDRCNAYPESPNRIGVFTKRKLDDWFALEKEYERLNEEYDRKVAETWGQFLAKRDYYIKKFGKAKKSGEPGVLYDDRDSSTFYIYRGGLEIYFTFKDTFIDCHADFYYKLEKSEENIMKIADNAYDMAVCNKRYDEYMNSFRKKAV